MKDAGRSERALRESEEKFRALFHDARDGIVLIDAETGGIVDCNPEFERQSGRDLERLKAMKIWEVRPPEKAEAAREKLFQIREKGLGASDELELQRPGGERVPVEFATRALTIGGRLYLQSIVRDISGRKRAEETLLRHAMVFRSMREAVMIFTHDGIIVDLNPAAESLFGYSRGELLGRTAEVLNPPERAEEIKNKILAGLDREGVWEGQIPLVTKTGERRTLSTVVSCVRDAAGEWIGNIGINRDVTERLQLEEQLRHAQKMEAVGTLSGGLAHDFNNLLAGILGYASIIKRRLGKESPFYYDLEQIETLSLRGGDLTQALLAFSRKGRYQPRPLAVNRLIRSVLRVLGGTAGKNVEILADLSEGVSNAMGDEGQLHQVFMNLGINACESMPEGGTLKVATADASPDEDFFRLHPRLKRERYVRVRFSDTGVGMDAETRARIFEPFFTTKPATSGTGLGLSIVLGIVEGHGGCIDVESEHRKGTRFTLYLPATAEEAVEAPARPVVTLKGNETLLLVDDNAAFRESTGRLLRELGYRVLEAVGGEAALEILEERNGAVDLVLLDMIMKGMGGAECFKKIRERDPEMAVMICTGYSVDAAAQRLLRVGADGFIQKPFESSAFALKIREILNAVKSRRGKN